MDKNTLYGLLLMGLVIFGFMYINNKDMQSQQQQLQEQAEQQQMAEAEAARRTLTVDSIRSEELAGIAGVLHKAGTPETSGADSTAVVRYRTKDVNLLVRGAEVSGTVQAADTVLPYADVVASRFGDDLTLQNRIAALENLRRAFADAQRYGGFARHLNGEERLVELANDVVTLKLTTHGGNVAQATLHNYDTYVDREPKTGAIDTAQRAGVAAPSEAGYSFVLTSASQRFDTANILFQLPRPVNDSTVVMKLDLGDGSTWGLRYTLPKGSYVVHLDVVQTAMDKVIAPSVATVEMLWHQKMGRNERGRVFEERNSGIYYKYAGDSPDELGNMGDKEETLDQQLRWIAFKNQFFSSVMIPKGNFIGAEVSSTDLKGDPMFVKDLMAKATMNYSSTVAEPVSIDIFYGPNLYPLLKHLDKSIAADENQTDGEDLQLQNLIPLGWPIFRWVSTLIVIPVFTFLQRLHHRATASSSCCSRSLSSLSSSHLLTRVSSRRPTCVRSHPTSRPSTRNIPVRKMPWCATRRPWNSTAEPVQARSQAASPCCCRCLSSSPCSGSSRRASSCADSSSSGRRTSRPPM